MHTVAQIIEALQINNLPHLPNGDFIITEKLRDAIELLLSQQAVVPNSSIATMLRELNPYPSDVFTEPTEEEWKSAGTILKNNGIIPDRIFGKWGRMVWNNCIDEMEELSASQQAVECSTTLQSPQLELDMKYEDIDHEAEREVMIQAFDKVRKLFEGRDWIMEGRGCYPYNDDRYKEEVRNLYDEFDAIKKDVWLRIKTYTADYKKKIIAEYVASQQAVVEQTDEEEANEYATGYFISSECYDAQRDAFLAGCQHKSTQFQFLIPNASYLTNLQKQQLLNDLTK